MPSAINPNLRYRRFLTQLLGELSDEQAAQIFSEADLLHFDTGQFVFRQGDKENSLYIVLSGRLRVLHQDETGSHLLGDIAAGEPLGELALFTKEPRGASALALRKSTVLQLSETDYLTLVGQFPSLASVLTRFVIERLRRNAMQQKGRPAPKNIAVINLQPRHDMSHWTGEIQREFSAMGIETRVYDHEALAQADSDALFEEMENQSGLNFLVCSNEPLAWAHQCLVYCDLVVVATDFNGDSHLYEIERELALYTSNMLSKRIYLLLLHPENAPLPVHTSRWFAGRTLHLHLHVRKNNPADIRRFCRIVSHRAVGLVLGGGGTKGFAHVGAARALMEAGIEFDFVGGTSAGALYGLGMSYHDFNFLKINEVCESAAAGKLTSHDYTFPFLSLMTGRKMRQYLAGLFGDSCLEDIWINTYCVSTNYSNATIHVHERGLTRQCIEASMAIPGVFPPVIVDGHLHVDGGVMDNLPIEVMGQKPVNYIIAVALSSQSPLLAHHDAMPTAWQLLWDKVTKARQYHLPGISSLLINSLILNSRQKQESSKSHVALYVELDLRHFGLLEWQHWQQLISKGYEQTQQYLAKLPSSEHV